MDKEIPLKKIAKALYTINRHAKTALEPQHLYHLKKEAIKKLLEENKAKKIGIHYSNHPKLSNQHSTTLVSVDKYFFHIFPEKDDLKNLKHLGKLDDNFRNPKTRMSLSYARKIIYKYIEWEPSKKEPQEKHQKSSYYIPSSLGKMEWPPTKSHHR